MLIWVAIAQLRRDANMWPIGLSYLSVVAGVPMLVGCTVGLLYWRIRIGQKLNPWMAVFAIGISIVAANLIF